MEIIYKDLDELHPYEKNNKNHDSKQVKNVAESIKQYGFVQPLVIDKNNVVVIGHCRLLAAKKLKLKQVPCLQLENLNDEQIRKLRIVDNKTNESEWNIDNLLSELEDLDFSDFDFDFSDIEDLENTIEEIIEDEPPEINETEIISKKGDIFKLGNHILMCGDSTNNEDVKKLMNGDKADMIFTDPPYNVDYRGGGGTERKILNDCYSSDEECAKKLWLPAFKNMIEVANDCCSYYCCMPQGGTHMMMMMMMKEAGWEVKHELIWEKQSIVLNRADYNYQHEPIMYGWNKKHKFYGKGQFHTTSIWKIDRPTKSKEHPTMKPIALIVEALENSSVKNNIVLDLFGGSGSTLIACEQTNRKCRTMELDPKYCDVIIKRWENLTGKKAQKINEI